MLEVRLQLTGEQVLVTLDGKTTLSAFSALPSASSDVLAGDALTYGQRLFEAVFADATQRQRLTDLPVGERLLLVADDPQLAAIPWEYLRDTRGKLLAARLAFVRALPAEQRRDPPSLPAELEIVAVPVSAVDETNVLNVEGEWRHVQQAVLAHTRALTLTRVRPPTRTRLERTLSPARCSIVHFMGHGTLRDGKGFLFFEDELARSQPVDAADLADSLPSQVLLTVLNSCHSAEEAPLTPTPFSNIARLLVERGCPYALGMQSSVPDDAALLLSETLYGFLLQGHDVEHAVMHVRRVLLEDSRLQSSFGTVQERARRTNLLAGLPVLYTSLRTPAPPLVLASGQPTIQPDPQRLQHTCDLSVLSRPEHFVGRGADMSEALGRLLAPSARGFVFVRGLGGIGKTTLARAVAERAAWYYADTVWAYSFETFARLDAQQQRVIDESFPERFIAALAEYYGLDPSKPRLQQAILQRRQQLRSLLVFDNLETLFDAQRLGHPVAQTLSAFLRRLQEGDGAILCTTRQQPPSDWGRWPEIALTGLAEEDGARLFDALQPSDRIRSTAWQDSLALSRRVQGHPLSIRLLAGRFADESAVNLHTFLQEVERELALAEQATPTSLEDPERQRTLYACLDGSIKRLTPAQALVLQVTSLFQSPFPPDYAAQLLTDDGTLLHLQTLQRLSLLEVSPQSIIFQEGPLDLLELHPMVRWYIKHHMPAPDAESRTRYANLYVALLRRAYKDFYTDVRLHHLVRQSLPDSEAALLVPELPPRDRSALAYHLAYIYRLLGQPRRALELYQQSLAIYQELGDRRGVAVTQQAMADVLVQQGKPQEALRLYEESFRTDQELGDRRGMAVTQNAMANVLVQQGKPQEAMQMYQEVLIVYQELGERRGVAVTQHAMANVLVQQGKPQEALRLYEESFRTDQELGDRRGMAVTQQAMAHVLVQQGKPQEALRLYEESLRTAQELGDRREVSVTQQAMANVLVQQGKPQEAMRLYEESLRTKQELGDRREVAVTQHAMANVLVQQGKPQEAMVLYEEALRTKQELGDRRGVAVTQHAMANVLVQQGKPQEAMRLYEESLRTTQELGDRRGVAVTQIAMAIVLFRQGEHERALLMAWEAYQSVQQLGYVPDVQGIGEILVWNKQKVVGAEAFDRLWERVVGGPEPDWLRDSGK